jgi:aspartate carbamoyltransferase catalytic subunit
MRHLLGIDGLTREQIERYLGRAEALEQLTGREKKKLPTLAGRTVINLFLEPSTRTMSSFELAAKRLSADTLTVRGEASSVQKGESLKDTVQTLTAYGPAAIVVRSRHVGAAHKTARWTTAAVVNAGDGKHEHPTQALLDAYTLRRRLGSIEGLNVWIIGDVLHSRVARSNVLAFAALGAQVTVAAPPTLVPIGFEELGCDVRHDLRGSESADVLYVLRMQYERMETSFLPSQGEYVRRFQIDGERLGAGQLLMHPGPVNRGVELASEVVDAPNSLILEQVQAGVIVRMAVLYELLAGAPEGGGVQARAATMEVAR